MKNSSLIFESIQMLSYLCTFVYLYVSAQAPFEWFNFAFSFLPLLIFAVPSYALYLITQKALFHISPGRLVSFVAILLSYTTIAVLSNLVVVNFLQQQDSVVTKALADAHLYAPLVLLPFVITALFHVDFQAWSLTKTDKTSPRN